MYLRRTTRRVGGKTYHNYLLVESVATPKGPRQRVICSLGTLAPGQSHVIEYRVIAKKEGTFTNQTAVRAAGKILEQASARLTVVAAKLDLMALVALFPPTADRTSWRVVPVVFTPDETLQDRAHRDRAPYLQWKEAGYLTAVPELLKQATAHFAPLPP